jgi:hypothetical protein
LSLAIRDTEVTLLSLFNGVPGQYLEIGHDWLLLYPCVVTNHDYLPVSWRYMHYTVETSALSNKINQPNTFMMWSEKSASSTLCNLLHSALN